MTEMTDEQKKQEIRWLYQQLDKLGQMIEDDDEWGATRRELNREYRRVVKALARLEPDKWKDILSLRKPSEKYDKLVADFCREHKCRKCGGDMRQSRSGSLRIVCKQCGAKYQLKTKKR
jgi:cupin superfamily acireductone dioxygenase involved in methionine salvage